MIRNKEKTIYKKQIENYKKILLKKTKKKQTEKRSLDQEYKTKVLKQIENFIKKCKKVTKKHIGINKKSKKARKEKKRKNKKKK